MAPDVDSLHAQLDAIPDKTNDDARLPDLKKNADGSATVYFGPKAPAGQQGNWIETMPGKGWNVILRRELDGHNFIASRFAQGGGVAGIGSSIAASERRERRSASK